jgi:GMP synthase-like glutamine amidotransferase
MQGKYPPTLEGVDALLLTGSRYSAYASDAWITRLKEYIRWVYKESTCKLIGICFGHQIVAEALDGKVEKNVLGWEVGWTRIAINDKGRTMFSLPHLVYLLISASRKCIRTMLLGFRLDSKCSRLHPIVQTR